jgi:hypothetical protein
MQKITRSRKTLRHENANEHEDEHIYTKRIDVGCACMSAITQSISNMFAMFVFAFTKEIQFKRIHKRTIYVSVSNLRFLSRIIKFLYSTNMHMLLASKVPYISLGSKSCVLPIMRLPRAGQDPFPGIGHKLQHLSSVRTLHEAIIRTWRV